MRTQLVGRTELHDVVEEGSVVAVADIVKRVDVWTVNARLADGGLTALHIAAKQGFGNCVLVLIVFGAEVDARDEYGNTPLMFAAAKGRAVVASYILTADADPDARRDDGKTALHLAAYHGHTETARHLLTAYADVNARSDRGETPLHLASRKGNAETVSLLLDCGADASVRADTGITSLMSAVRGGRAEAVRRLLYVPEAVSLLNKCKDDDGNTALHYAAKRGRADVASALLCVGADMHSRNFSGETPLRIAVSRGHSVLAAQFVRAAHTRYLAIRTMDERVDEKEERGDGQMDAEEEHYEDRGGDDDATENPPRAKRAKHGA